MKKKSLLLAVGLAFAGLLCSRVQSCAGVYGGNIVGYVNHVFVPGYNFANNPLNGTNNNVSEILAFPPNGLAVYAWNVASQSFDPPITYTSGSGWSGDVNLPVGKGFVLQSLSQWTNTFVGEVLLNTTNLIAGTNKFSLIGSMVPQSGALSSVLEFPPIDGCNVYFFRNASNKLSDAFTFFNGYGWFDPAGVESTGGPKPNVAESFFVQNPGPDTNWIRNFVINIVSSTTLSTAKSTAVSRISSIAVKDGNVTLAIQNPDGGAYDVQHSTDGVSWKTVARNQKGAVWKGRLPDGVRGYYRAFQP